MANFDWLTGLPNRWLLGARPDQAISAYAGFPFRQAGDLRGAAALAAGLVQVRREVRTR
jgi:hypothetical protein